MFSKKPEERSPAGAPRTMASSSTFSVFGTDVVVMGVVTACADLHVDGTVEKHLRKFDPAGRVI